MATAEIWTYGGGVRTDVDLTGYDVQARDGSIGTVDEATNEVGASYLVVDTGPWILGKHVLLPAGVIERIDTGERRITVGRTRDEIRSAPEYDPEGAVTIGYREQVGSYYAARSVGGDGQTGSRRQRQSRQPQSRQRASARSTSRSSKSRTRSTSARSRTKSSAARSRTTRARSSRARSEGPTKEELYNQAKRLNIEGRSKMNKTQLARAVGRKRGGSTRASTSQRSRAQSGRSRSRSSGTRRAKASPVEVQRFLDGVSYPTRKGDLVREAERSGARREVRSTLERLPEERFSSPTEVSEAIGKLR